MRHVIALAPLACLSTGLAQAQDLQHLRYVVPPVPVYAYAVVDWDGDEDLDQIVGFREVATFFNPARDGVYWLENQKVRFAERKLGPGGNGDLIVGDWNEDGMLDVLHASIEPGVLLFGAPGGGVVQGVAPSLGQNHGFLDAADVDRDGDLDLLFTATREDLLALNDGNGSFVDASANLPDTSACAAAAFIDREGDGDVDIHRRLDSSTSEFRTNTGGGSFVQGAVLSLMSPSLIKEGFRRAIDLDRDGDLDLDYSQLWLENRGSGVFVRNDKPGFGKERWLLDFDGDGILDVVSNNRFSFFVGQYDPGLFLFRGTGTGFVFYPDATLESVPFPVGHIDARDWDRDGDDDVLLPLPAAYLEAHIPPFPDSLLWSHGLAGFEYPDPSPEGSSYANLHLADVDVDGDLDLMGGLPLAWTENHGTGARWTERSIQSFTFPHEFSASDLEGDGDPDVIAAAMFSTPLALRRNNGDGTWTNVSSGLPVFAASFYKDLLAVDLSGDGLDDILYLQTSSPAVFLRNDGSGAFVDATATTPIPATARHAEAADIDRDGDLDVVFATENLGTRELAAYSNVGGALFPVGSRLSVPDVPPGLDYGVFDLDANGSQELLVTYTFVKIHAIDGTSGIQTTPLATLSSALPPEPPYELLVTDLTGDGLPEIHLTTGHLWRNLGALDFLDVSSSLPLAPRGVWGAAAAAGDLDLDGDVDLARAGELQLAWNVERQLARRLWPRAGLPLVLDFYGSPSALFGLWATLSGTSPVSNVAGTFRLDPTDLVFVGAGTLDGAGRGALSIPVPEPLSVVGQAFDFQALIGFPYRWSNVEPVELTPR